MATAELRISVLDTDAARVALCALARISEGWEDPRGIAEQALERIYEMSAREAA